MTENPPPLKDAKASEVEMRNYGVKRVPVDYFHVGRFRYTDLNDAMAQARRVRSKP